MTESISLISGPIDAYHNQQTIENLKGTNQSMKKLGSGSSTRWLGHKHFHLNFFVLLPVSAKGSNKLFCIK